MESTENTIEVSENEMEASAPENSTEEGESTKSSKENQSEANKNTISGLRLKMLISELSIPIQTVVM
ncbi:MAG: hypothetical protein IJ191_06740 [Treponema sp.]|nr:hypothetical protein [Treponema sp.]